jgi:hypothetical protein
MVKTGEVPRPSAKESVERLSDEQVLELIRCGVGWDGFCLYIQT